MLKPKFIAFFLALFIIAPFTLSAESFRDSRLDRQNVRNEIGQARSDFKSDEILVKYANESTPRRVRLSRGESVETKIEELKSETNVEFAEPNYIATTLSAPNDTYFPVQWDLQGGAGGMNMPSAWDLGSGSGVTVAVIDTGIAYENYIDPATGKTYMQAPDLSGTCFVQGYDFVNHDTHANDDESHGTHVAGTIAQTTGNGSGVAGVAYSACLMPIKVLDKNGSGTYADVADGIRFAADHGAKVINLSLGGTPTSQTLQSAVQYAYQKGVTIIAAAGNSGNSIPIYPAGYNDYVIAVGATQFDAARAPYSNFGSYVDVVAPGGNTSLDQNHDGYGDGIVQNTFNPSTKNVLDFGYWFFQGTSMATPHVAGAAALVIGNGNVSAPSDVRKALESTAKDLGPSGKDNTFGWGLVNPFTAMQYGASTPPPSYSTPYATPYATPYPTPYATPYATPYSTPYPTPTPPPSGNATVFSDSFEVSEWNGLWSEDTQNDWYRSRTRATNGSYSAEFRGSTNNATITSVPVSLAGNTNATVSFSWYIQNNLDTGEYLAFDVSTDNGNTWQEVSRLSGNNSGENIWHSFSRDFIGINSLKLRFRAKTSASGEHGNVDNVKVTAW